MKIIKEYCKVSGHCVIRTNTYGHSLALMQKLFETARQDFPELDAEQVKVVQFAGRHYARTYGIMFKVEAIPKPKEYDEIAKLENEY